MRVVKLRDLLQSWDAGAWGEPATDADGVSVLRSTNFREGGRLSFENEAVLAIDDMTLAKKKLAVGDILLERSGGGPLQPVGRVAGFWGGDVHDKFICGNFISRLVPKQELVDSHYLLYVLLNLHVSGQTEKFQTATTGIRNLQMKQYLDNELVVPLELEEQRQIAARLKAQLTEVETARQAVREQLRETNLLRRCVLQTAFNDLTDAPQKVLGEWAQTTSGSTPPRGDKRYWSSAEIPWVKTAEVAFAPIVATEEAISRKALAECSLTLLPPKTVLIAMYGQGKTRGQSAILNIEAATNQACFAILPNETWDSEFLHYWLMASYENLRSLSEGRGGNQANLNGNLLNALEIPAPDINEQHRMVQRIKSQLAEVDALHTALTSQQRELDALPQRLLTQAFDLQGKCLP
ncbi:MAG: restriction endonuclease subunit S [Betaproteobacteria bacterium]|nr:restriction endonuclease subunit S [Betaproteobacteria bacterium]